MATAGYLNYDGTTKRFSLPAEHASVFAHENGPFFVGGIYQMLPAQVGVFDQVVSAFRNGGGVPQSQYNDMMWDGLERFTSTWFENLLLQQWIPAMPEVKAHLERGCDVADVGRRGRGLIKLAEAFPRSRYVGYDNFGPTVARATANAREAGVSDQVRFEERDVSKGLPAQFDVIATFDVVHDAVDPLQLLQSIRRALRPGGIYVCLDINCSEKLEENANPFGAMFHGVSVFYCMTTSLAKMARDWARSVFMKRRSASFARRPASAVSGACRWKILSTIYTKQNPKVGVAAAPSRFSLLLRKYFVGFSEKVAQGFTASLVTCG